MNQRIVVVGAGGSGRETIDVIEAINAASATPKYELVGVVDAGPSETNLARLADRGIRYLGAEDDWLSRDDSAAFVVGIGAPQAREAVARKFLDAGRQPVSLIHPGAVIGSRSTIGLGSIVGSGVQITTNVRIGQHVHVNVSVMVGHDTILEDFVSVNPGAAISGEVLLEKGSYIGTTAVVLQNLIVGSGSTVGASACVVRDVEPGTTVKGVPAR